MQTNNGFISPTQFLVVEVVSYEFNISMVATHKFPTPIVKDLEKEFGQLDSFRCCQMIKKSNHIEHKCQFH